MTASQLAEKARKQLHTYTIVTDNTIEAVIQAVIEEAVQDYDERICNHIITMIERLSARKRRPPLFLAAIEKAYERGWRDEKEVQSRAAQENEHKAGCPALGGYGHGIEPCICGAAQASGQWKVEADEFGHDWVRFPSGEHSASLARIVAEHNRAAKEKAK